MNEPTGAFLAIPLAAATAAIGHRLPVRADVVTPGIVRLVPARAAYSTRPRRAADMLAGDPGEPLHIGLGVVPAHVDRRFRPRPQPLSLTCGAQSPWAAQASHSSNVSCELRHRERLGDRNLVLRALNVSALPSGEPIMKCPAGTTIISGQSLHSFNASPCLTGAFLGRLEGGRVQHRVSLLLQPVLHDQAAPLCHRLPVMAPTIAGWLRFGLLRCLGALRYAGPIGFRNVLGSRAPTA